MKNQIATKGDLSHAWWRSMRVLFEEGRPLQPHVRLAAAPTAKGSSPFGVLAKTQAGPDRHRLIYWPPLPKGLPEPTPEHPHIITDHVTLDLWNGKSHPTWYRHDGKSQSPDESRGWKLAPVEGEWVSHWFTMMIQTAVLDEQDFEVEANVRFPTTDAERRAAEYVQHAQQSPVATVKFPPLPQPGNFACCSFFVVTDEAWMPTDLRPLMNFIVRLPLWTKYSFAENGGSITTGSIVEIEGTRVAIVTAFPGSVSQEQCEFAISAVP